MPYTGGLYVYIENLYGRLLGFLAGWMQVIVLWASNYCFGCWIYEYFNGKLLWFRNPVADTFSSNYGDCHWSNEPFEK